MTILAIAFFGFNLFGFGLALVAFFCNLIFTSWSFGLISSGWCCATAWAPRDWHGR
jgi:ABC-2 type transport system permease protein